MRNWLMLYTSYSQQQCDSETYSVAQCTSKTGVCLNRLIPGLSPYVALVTLSRHPVELPLRWADTTAFSRCRVRPVCSNARVLFADICDARYGPRSDSHIDVQLVSLRAVLCLHGGHWPRFLPEYCADESVWFGSWPYRSRIRWVSSTLTSDLTPQSHNSFVKPLRVVNYTFFVYGFLIGQWIGSHSDDRNYPLLFL